MNIHLSCPSTTHSTNRYTKTLDSWNVKQGKIHTEKIVKVTLKAKKSDRCRSVKYKITFLTLFKSLVILKLSYKSFVTLGENVNLGFENKKN